MTDNARLVATAVRARLEKYPDTYNQDFWFNAWPRKSSMPDDPVYSYLSDIHDLDWYAEDTVMMAVNHPQAETWNECGTTGCVAGHAVAVGVEVNLIPYLVGEHEIYNYAKKLLGLDDRDAGWLFADSRTKDEVMEALANLAQGLRLRHAIPARVST
ncbi:MAG: hypothetical protein OXC91_05610 [Rhodobacteraceae bacterium]|nr:hypothetical protein [Paracoccaceae bacterium]